MNKKNVILLIVICVIVLVATVLTLFLSGVFSTPKLEVYNLVTENSVVKNAREEEEKYNTLISLYPTAPNIAQIDKVNKLVKITTNMVDELTPYVLFVVDDGVNSKNVKKSYENYIGAKTFANAKLEEALNAQDGVNLEGLLEEVLNRYSTQAVSYNNFCNDLKTYVEKACFEANPKTLKYTLLTFCQGFNSYMINNYVQSNNLTKQIEGISINGSIYNKYLAVKNANSELLADNTKALEFVDKFFVIDDINKFYEEYSKGEANLTNSIANGSFMDGKDASLYGEQKPAWSAVCEFIVQSSYLGGN